MFGIEHFGTFLFAGILLNLTPGADTVYILSRSISNGKKAGIFSALGIGTGSVIHTILAAAGLSVLLTQNELAYTVVKIAGACYLIYLGVKSIWNKSKYTADIESNLKVQSYTKVYFSGIITNVLNPKVALFYLAFLPQFINPEFQNPFISFLILGLAFTITGTIWCLLLALFSSILTESFAKNRSVKKIIDYISGVLLIGLGLKIAFSEK